MVTSVAVTEHSYLDECKGLYCQVHLSSGGESRTGLAYLSEEFVSDYIDEAIINSYGKDPEGKVTKHLTDHIMENHSDFFNRLKNDDLLCFANCTDDNIKALRQRLTDKHILPL